MKHFTSTILLAAGLCFAGPAATASDDEDTGYDASGNATHDEGRPANERDQGWSSDSAATDEGESMSDDADLFAESWASEHDVAQFAKALRVTGLASSLRDGEYTIFAPTDEALGKLEEQDFDDLLESEDKTALLELVRRHIVADRVDADDTSNLQAVMVLTGATQPLVKDDDDVSIGDATIIERDIELAGADRLMVHTIDGVLDEGDQQLEVSAADSGAVAADAADDMQGDEPDTTSAFGSEGEFSSDTASSDMPRSGNPGTPPGNPSDVVDLETFDRLDTDADGYLSQSEMAAEAGMRQARESLDMDADGRVSRSEFAAMELRNRQPSSQSEGTLDTEETYDRAQEADADEGDY
jgi:uncharacterized surface protein with fasciclin (FAS1) repeats